MNEGFEEFEEMIQDDDLNSDAKIIYLHLVKERCCAAIEIYYLRDNSNKFDSCQGKLQYHPFWKCNNCEYNYKPVDINMIMNALNLTLPKVKKGLKLLKKYKYLGESYEFINERRK